MRGALAALALSCALVSTASAHDTFLLPDRFEVSPGEEVSLALSSASAFPELETGPRPERVASANEIVMRSYGPEALRFSHAALRSGPTVLGLSLGPRDIDLQPADALHYFEEIGVSAATRAAYEAIAEPRILQETYTKYAKAIICVAPCRRLDADAGRLFGHALEFAAFVDRGGVSMRRFQLFAKGATVPNHQVTATTADGRRRVLRTDARGIVDLPDDVRGPTLLSATILRPPSARGERFTSDFATLTFVAP